MSETARWKPPFLAAWMRNPRQVGAIVPSGGELALCMAAQVGVPDGLVIELGAGTGAVTRALLGAGITPAQLMAVERDPHLTAQLLRRFPGLTVIQGDAARLAGPAAPLIHDRPVAAIVSSLPLLSMHPVTRLRALVSAFRLLQPGGRFIQFTYGPGAPIPAKTASGLGVHGRRVARVLRNLPPASVWVYERGA